MVNPAEAALVRQMYEWYLETGNVRLLQAKLKAVGAVSKSRSTPKGSTSGGSAFMAGAIYKILKSRVYLGEIPHKDVWYPGQQEAIIDPALFDKVQGALALGLDRRKKGFTPRNPAFWRDGLKTWREIP